MSDTLARLQEVFIDAFDDDDLAITRDTTAADVEGWDSLMHVTLMLQVEGAFGIRMTSAEVTGLKNVGQLVDIIEKKRGGA
jgi:acyl carrier protein